MPLWSILWFCGVGRNSKSPARAFFFPSVFRYTLNTELDTATQEHPMGGCCPPRDPDQMKRTMGLLLFYSLVAILSFLIASWISDLRDRPARRHHVTDAEEHPSAPMPSGHLDRG